MKNYSTKTLLGNWTEDRRLPSWEGTVPSALTEQQIRNFEATEIKLPAYGAPLLLRQGEAKPAPSPYAKADDIMAMRSPGSFDPEAETLRNEQNERTLGLSLVRSPKKLSADGTRIRSPPPKMLKPEERFDVGNIIAPDKLYPESTWASLQSTAHFGRDNARDLGEFRPRVGMMTSMSAEPGKVAEYRERWINEVEPAKAEQRYTAGNLAATSSAVAGRFRLRGERYLLGAVKSLTTLVEKGKEKHSSDVAWLVARSASARFGLAQLHAFVSKGPSGPCLMCAGGTLDIHLTVDEGKELFQQLALEDPKNTETARALQLASTIGSCPTTRDGKLISDPAGAITGSRDTLIDALLAHDGQHETGLCPARQEYVDAAWALAEALGHGKVTVGVLKECFDPSMHPSVKASKGSPPFLTAVQCRKRFLDGLAFVCAGEPPAHKSWGMSDGNDEDEESLSLGATPDMLLPAFLHGEGMPATKAVSKDHFERYWRYISAAVDSDAAFSAILAACFHLDEAAAFLKNRGGAVPASPLASRDSTRSGFGALSPAAKSDPSATALKASSLLAESGILSPGSVRYQTERNRLAAAANRGGSKAARASAAPSGGKGSPDHAFAHLAVLVTHENGSKALVKIPKDRFLRVGNTDALSREAESDILDRLAAMNITGVAKVELDF